MPRPYSNINPILSGPGISIGTQGPAGPPGPAGNVPTILPIFSGEGAAPTGGSERFGSVFLDLTPFPAVNVLGLSRVITFVACIETVAGLANVLLRNTTDGEVVTGTSLNTPNLQSTQVTSSPLTVGINPGDLKDDKMYEVLLSISGASPGQAATITNARLEIRYV